MGMSAESRYEHNLKVLRRRDPSITSIFDQFSHVCVYHHNGEKWEKHGFEGSMFLYERDSYPPYGFYILNRMGMADYVQRLHPEDDIGAHGSYLMLRSYPDFTRERTTHLPLGYDKFSDVYKFDKEQYTPQKKGVNEVIGLWMFNTDAREPMIDVMIRLHSYIQRNIPYPDEYRYGPDRPPPPNPHLPTTNNVPGRTASAASTSTTTASTTSSPSMNSPTGDLAALLAKLSSASPSTAGAIVPPSEAKPTKMSINDLFAAVQSQTPVKTPDESSTISPPCPPLSTGIALLDSIFASAGSSSIPSSSPSSSLSTSSSRTVLPQTHTTTNEATTTSQREPLARRLSTASVSTTSSHSTGKQPRQTVQIYSPQPSNNKPNGILTLTQAVVDGLLDGSGVGKGAFTGVGGVDVNGYASNGGRTARRQLSLESSEELDVHDEDEEEILELDFADTRALSDMAIFDSRERKREKRKAKSKVTPNVDKTGATTDSVLNTLSLRSQPTENVEGAEINGSTNHTASAIVEENSVKECILDALFASASQNEQPGCSQSRLDAIQGKDDLVKEVERLLKHDQRFADALWEAYEARERGSSSMNSNQRKRTRRRQSKNGVTVNDVELFV